MRLDIIGSVASGKTTLAKRISQRFNIPYYEKDNVVWKRTSSGDEKRSIQFRTNISLLIISASYTVMNKVAMQEAEIQEVEIQEAEMQEIIS